MDLESPLPCDLFPVAIDPSRPPGMESVSIGAEEKLTEEEVPAAARPNDIMFAVALLLLLPPVPMGLKDGEKLLLKLFEEADPVPLLIGVFPSGSELNMPACACCSRRCCIMAGLCSAI